MNLRYRILAVGRRKLRTKHFIIGIISCLSFLVFSPLTATAGLIFSSDYEDGTFGNVEVWKQESGAGYPSLCCTHSAQVVTSQARSGNRAVKFELRSTDTGYQYGTYRKPYVRAELERYGVAHVGDTRWYGFSVWVDPTWGDQTNDPNGTIITQWHTNKDACDITKGPHLSINITRTLEWRVRNQSDSNPCTTNGAAGRIDFNLGAVQKGVWTDWVIYAKWSYGSGGVLKVWKDGKVVVDRAGPNAYNDQTKEFLKWGIYKSRWSTELPAAETLIIHLDNIKIGDANSSYAEVAPNPSQPPPLPPARPDNLQIIGW